MNILTFSILSYVVYNKYYLLFFAYCIAISRNWKGQFEKLMYAFPFLDFSAQLYQTDKIKSEEKFSVVEYMEINLLILEKVTTKNRSFIWRIYLNIY